MYVGIDISKETFDVAIPKKEKYTHLKLDNCKAGFEKLLKELEDVKEIIFVMEASGPYYLRLATYLHDKGMAVSVVNPLVIRRFCQMRLSRAKTDKKDSKMISAYGKAEEPELWEPESEHVNELRQLQTVERGLQKSLHIHKRQKEALSETGKINQQAKQSLEKIIKQLEAEIAKLQQQMHALVQQHYKEQFELLTSIPGIGPKSSMLLILITGGFTRFNSYKRLISYVGLSPRIFESGTSVKGRASVCKMGMGAVRKMLYVCSWSAISCNKACKELYERLKTKGKSGRTALVAVANKLLKQAFAIVTKKQFYTENL
mgnify:CR=1 FL=1